MGEVKALILVGGKGTRLRTLISYKPKVLAPIGERPFLEILVRYLRVQGIRHLVMCTGYLADEIERTFGDGRSCDVSIDYSREGTALGTAGAVKLARSCLGDATDFLVLNGDSFLEIDFRDFMIFHRRHDDAVATIAVLRMEDASRYGTVNVEASGRISGFVEKASSSAAGLVNGGVYAFSQAIWQYLPEGPASLERDVFPRLIDQKIYAQEQQGTFVDIGTPEEYVRAQRILRLLW
jgi:NDP-sugar pyrophosphorylase family protein